MDDILSYRFHAAIRYRGRLFMACENVGRTGRVPSERQFNTDAMRPDEGRRSFDWLGVGRLAIRSREAVLG